MGEGEGGVGGLGKERGRTQSLSEPSITFPKAGPGG